jgi:hypothetical protein
MKKAFLTETRMMFKALAGGWPGLFLFLLLLLLAFLVRG